MPTPWSLCPPSSSRFFIAVRFVFFHHNITHAYTLSPTFFSIEGLYQPRVSAIFGSIWLVGRFLYTLGYTSGDPRKRNTSGGIIHNIGYFGKNMSSDDSARNGGIDSSDFSTGLMLLSTYIAGSKAYNLLF